MNTTTRTARPPIAVNTSTRWNHVIPGACHLWFPHTQGQFYRQMSTSASTASSTSNGTKSQATVITAMEPSRLYQYLQLQSFTEEEMSNVYHKIREMPRIEDCNNNNTGGVTVVSSQSMQPRIMKLNETQVTTFLLQRIREIELELQTSTNNTMTTTEEERQKYAEQEAKRFMQVFANPSNDDNKNDSHQHSISQEQFVQTIINLATTVDMKRMWPITLSILLVGTSVGITTPAMPFVVENLGLTPGQYGTVVSAFALAKMAGNIPSAILVERHGRKPYLTFSLAVIALGVGGIGAATSFEQLYACRLLTGAGVAALTTASQLMVTDISTPLNRATTMSPIMSAFAAGTALGPAFGGALVDHVGLQTTFFMVGSSYVGVAMLNRAILQETKRTQFYLPWMQQQHQQPKQTQQEQLDSEEHQNGNQDNTTNTNTDNDNDESLAAAAKDALSQWVPLFQNPKIRSIMIMNGFYWFALSGAQMTLLPLLLTSPSTGLNMTASGVGQVYMLMSLVQVMSNPIMARYLVDRIGKKPAIAGGCAIIASSMACLPLFTDNWPLFVSTLGFWALGSSMLSTAPLAYISDLVEEDERAQAIAMLRTSGDVGFLFGASCIGGMANYLGGLEVSMQASGGILSAATLWFIVRQSLLNGSSLSANAASNISSGRMGGESIKSNSQLDDKSRAKED